MGLRAPGYFRESRSEERDGEPIVSGWYGGGTDLLSSSVLPPRCQPFHSSIFEAEAAGSDVANRAFSRSARERRGIALAQGDSSAERRARRAFSFVETRFSSGTVCDPLRLRFALDKE